MTELMQIEERLGHRFIRQELLTEALTHRSVLHEGSPPCKSAGERPHTDNQRLEFFGDAVLQLALTELVFQRFPKADEGELTKLRARLANRHMLCHLANKLSLGSYLLLGKGEETSGGRQRPSNLADVFEAVVGALYLDAGFQCAREFVLRQIDDELDRLNPCDGEDNPKGLLQEILQERHSRNPIYRIIGQTGPDHAKQFESVVEFEGQELGRGLGPSKKEAEMHAAQMAITHIKSGITLLPKSQPAPETDSGDPENFLV